MISIMKKGLLVGLGVGLLFFASIGGAFVGFEIHPNITGAAIGFSVGAFVIGAPVYAVFFHKALEA